MRFISSSTPRRESRPMIRRYSANVRLFNPSVARRYPWPAAPASRARAVRTPPDVLCSTDSKLAIRASMNSSIRDKAAAS